MNIMMCLAWFLFGMLVGALTIISIAVIIVDIKKEKDNNGRK